MNPNKRAGWLVMEYVNAPSLEKKTFHCEEDIKKVMFQVMDALSFLHKK
jgi:serine/threonine protein kinase